MATGESRWSSEGREVKRLNKELIPNGLYPLELKDGPRIGKAEGEGKTPYVKCAFVAQGTGKDGGKDRWVFHMLNLGLTPGKDGTAMPERGGQLLELAAAFGEAIDVNVLSLKDANGKEVAKYLDPKGVVEYLEEHAGQIVTGKVYIEKAKKNSKFDDQNKIEFFEPSNGGNDADEDAGDSEPDEHEGEDEAEEAPAKKPNGVKKALPNKRR